MNCDKNKYMVLYFCKDATKNHTVGVYFDTDSAKQAVEKINFDMNFKYHLKGAEYIFTFECKNISTTSMSYYRYVCLKVPKDANIIVFVLVDGLEYFVGGYNDIQTAKNAIDKINKGEPLKEDVITWKGNVDPLIKCYDIKGTKFDSVTGQRSTYRYVFLSV